MTDLPQAPGAGRKDRIGSRGPATGGALLFGAGFPGLMLLPIDFGYGILATAIALSGIPPPAETTPPPAPATIRHRQEKQSWH